MRHALLIFTFTALTAFGQMASYPPAAGLPSGATLPSTCSVGTAFILTTTVPGALYTCGPTANAWMLPPAGTGPFRISSVVPRQSVTLARSDSYWDAAHKAKVDSIVLLPIPEANTRLAALRSGRVDWIEVPPPDGIPSLKSAGFVISTNSYPQHSPARISRTRLTKSRSRLPRQRNFLLQNQTSSSTKRLFLRKRRKRSLRPRSAARRAPRLRRTPAPSWRTPSRRGSTPRRSSTRCRLRRRAA